MRHKEESRPHPIRHEQTWIGLFTLVGIAGATFGATQIVELADHAPEIVGSFAAGGLLIQNKIVEKRAEKNVTPLVDPRDNDGNSLVAVVQELPPI